MKKKKPTWENVIQVAKNRGMTPEEFIKMLIDNYEEIGLSKVAGLQICKTYKSCREGKMRYRSHNNLIRYFIEDHDQLPEAYLRSCKKFFKELSTKHQASSNKRQAVALWKPGIRVKNRFNRKV
jgi:hypothetical protein